VISLYLVAEAMRITVWSVTYNLTRGDVRVAMGRQYDRVHQLRLPQVRQ
jgi:hypothetical protein